MSNSLYCVSKHAWQDRLTEILYTTSKQLKTAMFVNWYGKISGVYLTADETERG